MKGIAVRFPRFALALLAVVAVGCFLVARAAPPAQEGFPTDWTHRHVIFSQPANTEQALRLAQDQRYWQQWYRQKVNRPLVLSADGQSPASLALGGGTAQSKGFWSEDMGSNATVGAGNFPAKYSFQIKSASCSDYVVFATGLTGASNQASILAYTNLYSGCSGLGNVPSIYWSYNTGGQVLTSPAISGDGSQVAFVQTNGTVASLVLLKYSASGGMASAPVTLTSVSTANYRSCTAPCMVTIPLENSSAVGINDTTSSVFPDYTHDIIYVGGASSWLLQFSGVFRSTPAEVMTGGFPVQLNPTAATALTSPVYDYQSGNIFVADSSYVYRVTGTGTVTKSTQIDFGAGMVAAPIVDSTGGYLYISSSNDNGTVCAGGACAGLYLFKISNFTATPVETTIGTASASGGNHVYEPAVDNAYYNSTNGTGNLYVCGGPGAAPAIHRVPVAAGAFTPAAETVATLTPATDTPPCSPVSDIYNPNATNGPEEWIFFGVKSDGHPAGCATGCAISFVSLPWTASTPYSVGQEILVRRTNNNVNYVYTAIASTGDSGTLQPAWSNLIATQFTDGGVTWINQGASTVTAVAGWVKNHAYAAPARIIDSNGNVEVTANGGTSGGTQPTWPTKAGSSIGDGTVTWINAGVWPSSSQASANGVSGIILDNVVSAGTEAGASQVYFSPLTNQTCTTSGGTGGCAIQASQSALK